MYSIMFTKRCVSLQNNYRDIEKKETWIESSKIKFSNTTKTCAKKCMTEVINKTYGLL